MDHKKSRVFKIFMKEREIFYKMYFRAVKVNVNVNTVRGSSQSYLGVKTLLKKGDSSSF